MVDTSAVSLLIGRFLLLLFVLFVPVAHAGETIVLTLPSKTALKEQASKERILQIVHRVVKAMGLTIKELNVNVTILKTRRGLNERYHSLGGKQKHVDAYYDSNTDTMVFCEGYLDARTIAHEFIHYFMDIQFLQGRHFTAELDEIIPEYITEKYF